LILSRFDKDLMKRKARMETLGCTQTSYVKMEIECCAQSRMTSTALDTAMQDDIAVCVYI
jgi:hypothetical protein